MKPIFVDLGGATARVIDFLRDTPEQIKAAMQDRALRGAPSQPRKPLTDAEFVVAIEKAGFTTWDSRMWALKHAIESRHGITGSADGEGA